MPEWLFDYYDMPGRDEPLPRLGNLRARIYDIITNPRIITTAIRAVLSPENGMGVENEQRFVQAGQIHDDYRISTFILWSILKWLHKGTARAVTVLATTCGPLSIIRHG